MTSKQQAETITPETGIPDTVIIDTGCSNLSSVRYAFERIGANICVSDDADIIKRARRVVLPGVGTATAAMRSLKQKNLIGVIQGLTQPVLGVCLGMQLLATLSKERSSEGQDCPCLDVIPLEIDELNFDELDIKTTNDPALALPLPHMGWNQITPGTHPLFCGIAPGSYVYFVHSYYAPLGDYTLASTEYGLGFSAAIGKGNFMGVQFHPEKSAAIGAQILSNFMEMGA